MRIEINAGGLGAGLAIAEYQLNMSDYVSSAEDVISCFKAVSTQTWELNGGVGNLQDAMEDISARIREEEEKMASAEAVRKQSNDFLELAVRVDKQVETLVDRNKDAFYRTNPWLKPDVPVEDTPWYRQAWDWICGTGEAVAEGAEAAWNWVCGVNEAIADGLETAWNWVADTAKKAWDGLVEFYYENKKIIDTIVLVVGAIAAIAAVIASGGGALVFLLSALGCSAGVAAAISGAVAVIAVVSTVAATTLNVIDIWAEVDDPTFQAWKKGLNIVSGVSNLIYSIGGMYNSFKGITPEQAKSTMKAVMSDSRGEWVSLSNGQDVWVEFASDIPGNQGADAGINRNILTQEDPGVFYSVKNQSGGDVVVSVNPVDQYDIINVVDNTDGPVKILSGTHGNRVGQLIPENTFYQQDYLNFSRYDNVDVFNICNLSPGEIKMIVNGPGTTVCAWCFSERSRVVLEALKLL